MKKKRNKPESNEEKNIFIVALVGSGIAISLMLALALLLPFVILTSNDPNSLVMPCVCVCAFVGCGVGSLFSAKSFGDSFILCGLLTFAFVFLPIVLISLMLSGCGSLINCFVILATSLASSLVFPLLLSKYKGSRKRSMKKALKRR